MAGIWMMRLLASSPPCFSSLTVSRIALADLEDLAQVLRNGSG
jgi:hypothetical protein